MIDKPATSYGYVDVLRVQVDERQHGFAGDAEAYRLARAGRRRNGSLVPPQLVRSYLRVWWVFRPRGAALARAMWRETAPIGPPAGHRPSALRSG